MDFKKQLKTYTFWIAVASGLFLLVQAILKMFDIVISKEGYMSAINGGLSLLVIFGILTPPPTSDIQDDLSTNPEEENKDSSQKENLSTNSQKNQKTSNKVSKTLHVLSTIQTARKQNSSKDNSKS